MSDLKNEDEQLSKIGSSRREFLTQITVAGAGLSFPPLVSRAQVVPASALLVIQPVNPNALW